MRWLGRRGASRSSTQEAKCGTRTGDGRCRPSGGRLAALVAVLALGGTLLLGAPASAAGPPHFRGDLEPPQVVTHSTRVIIRAELVPDGLATKWKAEYAPAEKNGEAPPENSSAWALVNGGELNEDEGISYYVTIGMSDPGHEFSDEETDYLLRHLTPDTAYYARFIAENSAGKGTEVIPFKTLPAGKPEIPRGEQEEWGQLKFIGGSESDTTASFKAKVEANGSETTYFVEYSLPEGGHAPAQGSASWKLLTSGATGTITAAEEYAKVEAFVSGLAPETTYYVRLRASNREGELIQTTYESQHPTSTFTTLTARPEAGSPEVRNITAASAYITALVGSHGSKTSWRLESAATESGPWTEVANGSISQERAEAAPYGSAERVGGRLGGLKASTAYYVRTVAENECAVGCGTAVSRVERFETSGGPSATAFSVHTLEGEALRLLGGVDPHSALTSAEQVVTLEGAPTGGTFQLTFKRQTTGATGTATTVKGSAEITDVVTSTGAFRDGEAISGPGIPPGTTIAHNNVNANGQGSLTLSVAATESAAGVTVVADLPFDASSEVLTRALEALPSVGGESLIVFGPPGGPYTVYFASPENSFNAGHVQPPIEANGLGLTPLGTVSVVTTQQGGEGYDAHYRFQYVRQKSFAESGWVGAEETSESDAGSGESLQIVGSDLPALTPGETYRYRLLANSTAPGTQLVVSAEQSLTVPVAPPGGEAGLCPNEAFRTGLSARLPDCRAYELLTPVDKEGAEEPFHYKGGTAGAVVVGEDGEHVALEAPAVNWGSGVSPYFFSREAGKSWSMVSGSPEPETGVYKYSPELYNADLTQFAFSSEYSIEPFAGFTSESPDIEYRLGPPGGPYKTVVSVPRQEVKNDGDGWVAANGDLSKLVLATEDHALLGEEPTGTKSGYDLYEYTPGGGLRQLNVGESGATIGSCGAKMAVGRDPAEGGRLVSSPRSVSADGARVFFEAVPGGSCSEPAHLYMRVNGTETVDIGAYQFFGVNEQGTRLLLEDSAGNLVGYDTETGTTQSQSGGEQATIRELALLGIPYLPEPNGTESFAHPRYTYIGAIANNSPDHKPEQAYIYDDVEHVVWCISCASPFDPKPDRSAFFGSSNARPEPKGGLPSDISSSANGDFAFFSTTAALLPQDVDGEIPTNETDQGETADIGDTTSPSSDIYEWRADGIDGCAHLQGCLALITDGRGGFYNLLLGTADEGRDVFIYTRSRLLPQDDDTSSDIYDVRIDGGLAPPPPRPVECEGDACSTPPNPPNDSTPSSSTFTGPGNLTPPTPTKVVVKSKKHRPAGRPKSSRRPSKHRRKSGGTGKRGVAGKAHKASRRTTGSRSSSRRLK